MKFFWKMFFTTMFISVICVTLSGYILISSNFNSQLDSEVKTAQDYGEIVYYSLINGFKDIKSDGFSITGEDDQAENMILQVVQSVHIDGMDQKITFGIMDANQNIIFSSLSVTLDKSMMLSLSDASAGWTLKKTEKEVYIQIMRPMIYLDNIFYIETIRDVTHVFINQREQYEMMIKIMIGMIVFAGVLTFVISKFLLRRIVALTEITKVICEGNLSKRAMSRGQDEIALLSQNFNQMANRLEEKIHELKEEAERKELFIGSFSHELKTPLTSIIGYSDLLRRKEMDVEQRHICAEYIFTEGRRLETLSMRLLDLIVLKKHVINPEPVRIKDIFDEVTAVMVPQLNASNIKLICNVEQAVIRMEAELMKTVFINVIDNARNAVEQNGKIRVSGHKNQYGYVITIRDSGKGMEKKELEKITNAFYMVDKSRSRKRGGVGLGLAICNEILVLHGFDIQFDSIVNVGTTVTIIMRSKRNE